MFNKIKEGNKEQRRFPLDHAVTKVRDGYEPLIGVHPTEYEHGSYLWFEDEGGTRV